LLAEHHRHKHKHDKEKRSHKHKRHRASDSDSDADDAPKTKKASEPVKLSDFLAQQSDDSD
jgi:hypothetical protein